MDSTKAAAAYVENLSWPALVICHIHLPPISVKPEGILMTGPLKERAIAPAEHGEGEGKSELFIQRDYTSAGLQFKICQT